ncbi:response regulator transcription factor [Lutibacter sp. B2]|nr:response regulator transcription factor [Lutibacter sp. B2]
MKSIIVEDEYPAREELKYFIQKYSSIEIENEFDTALAALKFLENHHVDIIFLDINMPNFDGVSFAKVVSKFEKKPKIIFITAHKDHAIEAFEIGAFDYILKPYSEERMIHTLKRLQKREEKNEGGKLDIKKIILYKEEKMIVIDPTKIYYCEAKERETMVYTEEEEYISKMNISHFLEKLPGNIFFRSHRSYIINIDKIQEIIPWFNNTYNVKLQNMKVEIPVSRNNVKTFRTMMDM